MNPDLQLVADCVVAVRFRAESESAPPSPPETLTADANQTDLLQGLGRNIDLSINCDLCLSVPISSFKISRLFLINVFFFSHRF